MKLIFDKKDTQAIEVKINHEEATQDFDYIAMLRGLIEYGRLDGSELIGDFSEAERTSIASMVKQLNESLPAKDNEEGSDDSSEEA